MVTEQPIVGTSPYLVYGRNNKLPLYSTDDKRSFIGINLNQVDIDFQTSSATKFVLNNKYAFRPDLISYNFYQTPLLGWYICEYNNIVDPFDSETGLYIGRLITIPSKSKIISGIY